MVFACTDGVRGKRFCTMRVRIVAAFRPLSGGAAPKKPEALLCLKKSYKNQWLEIWHGDCREAR